MTTSTFTTANAANLNTVLQGDCVQIMRGMQPGSVDFVITDPPYITRYCDRSGRAVANDDNSRWLKPAFTQVHRLLKSAAFCISFYGWNKADLFIDAWRSAGFRIGGHLVFRKRYPSSTRFLRYQHEQAYLLVKGEPAAPAQPIPDVIEFPYTGNKLASVHSWDTKTRHLGQTKNVAPVILTETANDFPLLDLVTGYTTDFRPCFGAQIAVTQTLV
jgi:DNA modification methylase